MRLCSVPGCGREHRAKGYCIQCYQRIWIAARRVEFFVGKRCAVWWCGSTVELELDHIDPKQKVSSHIWSWSQARRDVELAKCQVLCEPCHMDKTISQMPKTYEHGTAMMYQQHNCRCVDCRAWKSAALKRETRRQNRRPRK